MEFQREKLNEQKEPVKNNSIIEKNKIREICEDMTGNPDLLDDKVLNVLALLAEQMVDNVVDYSCQYARHRESEYLEKEDISFAVQKLFPQISRDNKVNNIQLVMDQ